MAVEFPSTQEEISKLQTNFKNNCSTSNPYLQSIFQAILVAIGMSIALVYDFFKYKVLPQILPFNPTDEYAEYWGNLIGVQRNDGTTAAGYVNFTGVIGTSVPLSTYMIDNTSNRYKTIQTDTISYISQNISTLTQTGGVATATTATAHNLSSGMLINITNVNQTDYSGVKTITVISNTVFTFPVNTLAVTPATPITGNIYYYCSLTRLLVSSIEVGSDKNLLPSSQLVIEMPSLISGMDSTSFVDINGFSGGTDFETNIDYVSKYKNLWSTPINPWNKNFINSIIVYDFGAYRSWVFPCKDLSNTDVAGVFSAYFVYDNAKDGKFLPTSTDIINLTNFLIAQKPAILPDSSILIAAPNIIIVDFVFTSISPNTTAMATAIINSLTFFFNNYPQVGESLQEIDYLSAIKNTIDETGATLTTFTLSGPTGNINVDYNEIAQLGTITI